MIEKGIVTAVKAGHVTISFVPSADCSSCRGCACGKDGTTMLMRIETDRDLDPGDLVTVEIQSRALLSSGFMVFILPLIAFIAGTLIAARLFGLLDLNIDRNAVGIVVGLAFMVIAFVLVFVFERKSSRVSALSPTIIDVEKKPADAHALDGDKTESDAR